MTFFRRAATASFLGLLLGLPSAAQAQRDDSYTWKFGLDFGSMIFSTHTQASSAIPSFGAHILVMAKRSGLLVGVTEGFGSDETSAGGLILFNDIRRYQALLMAFPGKGKIEPYFGIGGGLLQAVNPRVDPVVQDPVDRATLQALADDASTSGFATALVGVQGRWKGLSIFAQGQIGSAPNDDKLLASVLYSFHAGLRFSLGSAREGSKAGGY